MNRMHGLICSFVILLATLLPLHKTCAETPQTLLQYAGVKAEAARLSESVLIVIDAQREYLDGKLPLKGIDASLLEVKALLDRARKVGTPIIHIAHKGKQGGALFNPDGVYAEIIETVKPGPGESIVSKTMPNAFVGTNIEELISKTGRKNLVIVGYMTHMCVSSTVRAALDRGYRTTVVASATATRDLPDGSGGTVSAQDVQRASLAALADRFAVVVKTAKELPE